ncbi:N-acetyltransferase [Hypericibacter adhaerens]|jgi:GNAT superfamily N-acetyltransferase|uniref:N-acetyltransferase n=1 Tax=Hypericibacter adhaerens TaxID=2602016 RepID=A0A5J6N154_9PROT|nr:GNAT family N-acetyltransferase [Hypericibacter adhaerens]QEX22290.1 N-acetyltransferase [Hypericibacter adhaerens]
MIDKEKFIGDGYWLLPPGKLANVVVCLEMTAKPTQRPVPQRDRPFALERMPGPDLGAYRALFRRIGEDWMWFSRLKMPDDRLHAILADPAVEVFVLKEDQIHIGLLELDFREEGQCELAFFGLVPEAIGQGAGRFLMDQAIQKAWARPIRRLWVHTCSFDHPGALGFYRRSGFVPYAYAVEVHDDPRLTGHLPRTASPQIPLIEK